MHNAGAGRNQDLETAHNSRGHVFCEAVARLLRHSPNPDRDVHGIEHDLQTSTGLCRRKKGD